MKNVKFKFAIIVLLLLSTHIAVSQVDKSNTESKKNNVSYIAADINYISDAVFMGRRDSVTAPYLYPSITYRHKSGFYATGSLSYLTRSDEGRVDLSLLTAGYDFTTKKLSGDISFTKYFFNEDSYNVISEVEADVTATLSYDFNILNLGLSSSIYFNNNSSSDFFLSSEISHDFISTNNKFQISPTAGVYLGSQNFYEQYYVNNRIGSNRGSGNGQGNNNTPQTMTTVSIQESEKFNIMAVELSMPVWYSDKSITVSFLPTFVIPKSKATVAVDETLVEEDLKETFYWVIGLSYTFSK